MTQLVSKSASTNMLHISLSLLASLHNWMLKLLLTFSSYVHSSDFVLRLAFSICYICTELELEDDILPLYNGRACAQQIHTQTAIRTNINAIGCQQAGTIPMVCAFKQDCPSRC